MAKHAINVAVVDDDASVRKALARVLSASSFEVATYGSGQEFLRSLEVAVPECLVVDLHMPDLTGFELQRQLIRTGRNIPTIVVTAYNEPGLREKCQAAGAAAFLLKPLSVNTLVNAINLATQRHCATTAR